MAISINSVYQKVLTFANKEQRGYITPQEFNLFADHAQLEIFEQYFYDLNQYSRGIDSSEEYSDIIHNINEKIAIFESTAVITSGSINAMDLYRLGTVIYNFCEVEEVQQNEILQLNKSYLTQPSEYRPVYVRISEKVIEIYPKELNSTNISCTYIRKPLKPSWGYVVINNKAMYDPTNKVDFELHQSEENELVYKILKFAGLSMRRNDLAQGGQGLESLQIQQEKQ
jgi:hypothetical protein|tara:strand:+ start:1050 stop:1730 length:681 start_codon:yes stop_codon:yes gene_type:complete